MPASQRGRNREGRGWPGQRTPVERVDDPVGGGTRVEQPHRQGLPIEGEPVQIELAAELAPDMPETVERTVLQVSAHRREGGVEVAAAHVRKLDLGRIGLTRPDRGATAKP